MNYTIYQPKRPTFRVEKGEELKRKNYNYTYSEFYTEPAKDDYEVLEQLFCIFNMGKKPIGYEGHSLSVGDIVVLKNNIFDHEEKGRAYVCDIFGWKQVNFDQYAY